MELTLAVGLLYLLAYKGVENVVSLPTMLCAFFSKSSLVESTHAEVFHDAVTSSMM